MSGTRENQSDDELIRLVGERADLVAYQELVERYQQRIYRLCFRYLNRVEDAEDVAQETFIRLYQSAANYRAEGHFAAYLFRLATNACLNFKRDEKRRHHQSLDTRLSDEGSTMLLDILPGNSTPPSVKIRRIEQQRALQEALQELPERQRIALLLRVEFKADYPDVARALDTTVDAVEQLVYRARQNLIAKAGKILG